MALLLESDSDQLMRLAGRIPDRLSKAAPDLLKACIELLNSAEHWGASKTVQKIGRDAIAKARGK